MNQSKTDATKEKDEVHTLDTEVPSSDSESDPTCMLFCNWEKVR